MSAAALPFFQRFFSSAFLTGRFAGAVTASVAVTVSLALAQYFALEKPFWAGFTALVLGMTNVGQSMQKGLLRILGTLLGGAAALFLLAFWQQERGALLVAVYLFIMVMLYEMSRYRQYAYFFFTAIVVSIVIICGTKSGGSPFPITVARIEETLLGASVYTVLAVVMWKNYASQDMQKTARQFLKDISLCFESAMQDLGDVDTKKAEHGHDWKAWARLAAEIRLGSDLLPAARMESAAVRGKAQAWQTFWLICRELEETSEHFFIRLHRMKDLPDAETAQELALLPELLRHYQAIARAGDGFASTIAEEAVSQKEKADAALHASSLKALRTETVPRASHIEAKADRQNEFANIAQNKANTDARDDFNNIERDKRAADLAKPALYFVPSQADKLLESRQHQAGLIQELYAYIQFLLHDNPLTDPRQMHDMPQERMGPAGLFRTLLGGTFFFWIIVLLWINYAPSGSDNLFFLEMAIVVGMSGFLAGKIDSAQIILSFCGGALLGGVYLLWLTPLFTEPWQLTTLMLLTFFGVSYLAYLPAQGIIRMGLIIPWLAMSYFPGAPQLNMPNPVLDPQSYVLGAFSLFLCAVTIAAVFYFIDGRNDFQQYVRLHHRFHKTFLLWERARHPLRKRFLKWYLKNISLDMLTIAFRLNGKSRKFGNHEEEVKKIRELAWQSMQVTHAILNQKSTELKESVVHYRRISAEVDWSALPVYMF